MASMNETASGRTELAIKGMTCAGCASTVSRVLQRVRGVNRAEVDLERARAVVEGSATRADLVAATEAAGFEAAVVDSEAERG